MHWHVCGYRRAACQVEMLMFLSFWCCNATACNKRANLRLSSGVLFWHRTLVIVLGPPDFL